MAIRDELKTVRTVITIRRATSHALYYTRAPKGCRLETRSPIRPTGLVVLLLVAAGCATAPSDDRAPRLTAVEPDQVPQGQPTEIAIEGQGFEPAMYRNASCSGSTIEVDDEFTATAGDEELSSVIWIDGQHLEATVPDDLAAGEHTLTVVDPWGRTATLEVAFTVVASGDSDTDVDTDTSPDCSDNLLANPGAENGNMSGWNVTHNGGDGWDAVESAYAIDGDFYFGTSFEWCRRNQQIDLLALGFTADELDAEPEIRVSEHVGEVYYPDQYEIIVELRNASQAVIDDWTASGVTTGGTTCGPIGNGCHWDDDEWIEESHVFNGYGAGLRYIRFRDGSIDQEWWVGNYGAAFDAAEVIVCQ